MREKLLMLAVAALVAAPAFAQEPSWIGVAVDDGTDQGALVRSVEADGPAAKAGIKENDLIIEFNKTPVLGVLQLTRLVRETPVGRTVEVKVRRDNRDQTLRVTTAGAPRRGAFAIRGPDISVRVPRIEIPDIHIQTSQTSAGIRTTELTPQLRQFFGLKGSDGVLVSSVESASVAEKAGLKAGDVIISVDGDAVRTPSEFSRQMRSAGEKITLKIVRDKQERDITLDRPSARPARATRISV